MLVLRNGGLNKLGLTIRSLFNGASQNFLDTIILSKEDLESALKCDFEEEAFIKLLSYADIDMAGDSITAETTMKMWFIMVIGSVTTVYTKTLHDQDEERVLENELTVISKTKAVKKATNEVAKLLTNEVTVNPKNLEVFMRNISI